MAQFLLIIHWGFYYSSPPAEKNTPVQKKNHQPRHIPQTRPVHGGASNQVYAPRCRMSTEGACIQGYSVFEFDADESQCPLRLGCHLATGFRDIRIA